MTDHQIRRITMAAELDAGDVVTFVVEAEEEFEGGPVVRVLSKHRQNSASYTRPALLASDAALFAAEIARHLDRSGFMVTVGEYTAEDQAADEGDRLYHQARDEGDI